MQQVRRIRNAETESTVTSTLVDASEASVQACISDNLVLPRLASDGGPEVAKQFLALLRSFYCCECSRAGVVASVQVVQEEENRRPFAQLACS